MKKLTVFIPVYNQEELVIRALNSIPIRKDIEILIIDDCSTDNTLENCKTWKHTHKDMEVNIMHLPKNIGLGNVKNIAYRNFKGEYIHELDSDDYLYTEEYNKIIDLLDGTDMVYCDLVVNNGDVFQLTKDTQSTYCSGIARFIKKEFLGDTKAPSYRTTEDWYVNQELQAKPHSDKFTGIKAYHYNFPRENSLYDLFKKGELKVEEVEL